MAEETLLSIDERRDRTTVAATLRSLADQLESGEEVTLTAGAETVTLPIPRHCSFELDVEREDDELEIEIELGWTDGDTGPFRESEVAADAQARADDEPALDAQSVHSKGQFQVYEDRAQEWRWRLVHNNGNIIADSGEGYASRQNAEKGLRSVMTNAPGASVDRGD